MKDTIISLVKNACAIEEDVTPETSLNELSIDSLTFVRMLVEIEVMFEIEFEIEELNILNWKKVEDIYLSLEGKINAKE